MKIAVPSGTTSKIVRLFIRDTSQTTRKGLTGLAYNTSGLTAYYSRVGDSSDTSITLASATQGTYTSGGFVQIDATNMPGFYEFHIPNACLSAGDCHINLQGATNMEQLPIEIQTSNVPMATPTNFTSMSITSGGIVSANATQINGVSTSSVTAVNANVGTTQAITFDGNNLQKVDVEDIRGTLYSGAAGYFVDWSKIQNPTSTVAMSGTTVGLINGAIGYQTFAGTLLIPLTGRQIIVTGTTTGLTTVADTYIDVGLYNGVTFYWGVTNNNFIWYNNTNYIISAALGTAGANYFTSPAGVAATGAGLTYTAGGGAGGSPVVTGHGHQQLAATQLDQTWMANTDVNGYIKTDVAYINAIATTPVTTIRAYQGQSQDLTFDGNNLLKVDVEDVKGNAATATTNGILDINVKNWNNQTAQTDANNLPKVDLEDIKGVAVTSTAGVMSVNSSQFGGQAVQLDANNVPKVDVYYINAVATTGVTTINANIGTTQAVLFDANNLQKVDIEDVRGTAVTATTAGILDVNAKNIGNQAASLDSNNLLKVDVAYVNGVATTSVTTVSAYQGSTQPLNFTGTGASALVQVDTRDFLGQAVQLDGNNLPKVDLVDIAGVAVNTAVAQLGVNVVSGVTTPPTVQAIATQVWTDTTSSDFTTAGSPGYLIKNAVPSNLVQISGSSVATGSAQLGVNVVQYAGQTAAVDANNLPKVDVEDWKGAAVSAPATAGIPDVNTKNINNVSTSSVTTIAANLGTTSAVLFDTHGYIKSDVEDWLGVTAVAYATHADSTTIEGQITALGSPMQAGSTVQLATPQTNFAWLSQNDGTYLSVDTQVNHDKIGYALTTGEHTNIQSDVTTGLTTQGYTGARAGYLDVLNGLIGNIWAYATSSITTLGSIGKFILGLTSGGGGGSGSGAYILTVTITDSNSNPVPNALVTANSGTVQTAYNTTNSSGVTTLNLNAGVYTILATCNGYNGNNASVTVTGNQPTSLQITQFVPAVSGTGLVTGYLTCYDQNGNPLSGIVHTLKVISLPPQAFGLSVNVAPRTVTSGTGYNNVQFPDIVPGGIYTIQRGSGTPVQFEGQETNFPIVISGATA